MLKQVTQRSIVNEFKITNTQSFFGYRGCWKMVGTFFKMLPAVQSRMKWYNLVFLYLIQVPYWCLIKPLAQVWSIKTKYQVKTQALLTDGELTSFKFLSFSRINVHQFLLVPIFVYWTSVPNRDDYAKFKEEVLK